jgi:hypothetical protein
MPRLKYHNPTVPMTVSPQLKNLNSVPAFLNIHLNKSLAPAESESTSDHFIFSRERNVIPTTIDPNDSSPTTESPESLQSEETTDSATLESSTSKTQSATPNSKFQALKPSILDNPTLLFRTTKTSPGPAPNERIVQIPVLSADVESIWADFLKITNATQLEPTAGELEAMEEIKEKKEARKMQTEEKIRLMTAIKQAQAGY